MAIKLTPTMLKRMVLEEKKKLEGEMLKANKEAARAMHLDMDESGWEDPSNVSHAKKRTHASSEKPVKGDGNGPGDVEGYKALKEAEVKLKRQLALVQERRIALRKKIIDNL